MEVSRRNFLKLGTSTAAGTFLLGHGMLTTQAMAAAELTSVIYFTSTYQGVLHGAKGFVNHLAESEKGAVAMDFFHSGQLVKADEQLPALRAGSIDLMFHATSYITRSFPVLGITGMPGVVGELYRHPERLKLGSPLFNLINEELAKENLYMLSAGGGILEPEYIWSTEDSQIRSLEDLRGKKVRIASFEATKAAELYQVAAVRLTSSETYLALQRGIVDAAVANIGTVAGRSLYEQISTCYQLPLTAYTVAPFMLRSRWDALDADVKDALQGAAQWYDNNMVAYCNNVVYPEKYWPTTIDAGVEVIQPTESDLTAFNESTHAVWDHWKGVVGKETGDRAIALALGQS